ncbi:MAG: multicopper oxidase domain-containing protein [Vicinamibacterales bacterium]
MQRRDILRLLAASPIAVAARAAGLLQIDTAFAQAASPDVEIELTASPTSVSLLPGAPTNVWHYSARLLRGPASTLQPIDGTHLGPVIRVRRGQRVRVRFRNQLPESSIVHWHGLDVPESADGHPADWQCHRVANTSTTSRSSTARAHRGITRIRTCAWRRRPIRDSPASFSLQTMKRSAEAAEWIGRRLFALQDRRVDANNQSRLRPAQPADSSMSGLPGRGGMGRGGMMQMMETMNGWLGNRMLVSGRIQPTIDVDRRTVRVRVLNGSNSRFYKLAWSDQQPLECDRQRRWTARTPELASRVDARAGATRRPHSRTVGPPRRRHRAASQPAVPSMLSDMPA